MFPSFVQEESARVHSHALTVAAQRAAESAQYRRALRKKSRMSQALGIRIVRMGLRLTGGRAAVVLKGTRRAPEPMLVRR